MKTIKNLNTFAIVLPIAILITYPFFKEGSIFYSLFSTMVTGFIQVLLGIILLLKNPKSKLLQIYILSVILFFSTWYINYKIDYYDTITFILLTIPPILAIYLSVIIYKKSKL